MPKISSMLQLVEFRWAIARQLAELCDSRWQQPEQTSRPVEDMERNQKFFMTTQNRLINFDIRGFQCSYKTGGSYIGQNEKLLCTVIGCTICIVLPITVHSKNSSQHHRSVSIKNVFLGDTKIIPTTLLTANWRTEQNSWFCRKQSSKNTFL